MNIFKNEIITRVKFAGGYCNAHAHIDRAYTVNNFNLAQAQRPLQEKWDITRELKTNATVGGILYRMSQVVEDQIAQGVTSLTTFLDFDEYSEDKPYSAFQQLKEIYKDRINLYCCNQTLQGLEDLESLKWFIKGSEVVDILGSLPGRDKDKSRHMSIVFKMAKTLGKPVHMHVDQFSLPEEKETELALDKIEEYKLEGKVSLIHCLSLACQPKEYRERQYSRMVSTETKVIACVTAWMDSKRSEVLVPFHSSTTPIDEMIEHGVSVSLGTDNISDITCPFSTGDMFDEVKLVALTNRIYNIDTLVKLATNKDTLRRVYNGSNSHNR